MSEEQSGESMLAEAEGKIAEALQDEVIVDEPEQEIEGGDISLDEAEETQEAAEPEAEVDPVEQAAQDRARAQGWRPLDEYEGDPSKWKDYTEFNAVGDRIASKLNNKIDKLEGSNRKQQDMIKKLIKAQGQVAKQAQADALAALRAQKREAIELGDADAVDSIDEKISATKAQEVIDVEDDEEEEAQAPQIDDEVKNFVQAERSWFNESNIDMVEYAKAMEVVERRRDPQASSGQVMAAVKAAVVQQFPGRVPTAPAKPKAKARQLKHSAVEGGTVSVPQGGVRKFSELPSQAQQIAAQFERDGIMSRKDYMKAYNEGLA
jgi:hypothetical protein